MDACVPATSIAGRLPLGRSVPMKSQRVPMLVVIITRVSADYSITLSCSVLLQAIGYALQQVVQLFAAGIQQVFRYAAAGV